MIFQDAVQHFGGNPSVELFKQDWKAAIQGRGNHPCIVQWDIFNEGDCFHAFNGIWGWGLARRDCLLTHTVSGLGKMSHFTVSVFNKKKFIHCGISMRKHLLVPLCKDCHRCAPFLTASMGVWGVSVSYVSLSAFSLYGSYRGASNFNPHKLNK